MKFAQRVFLIAGLLGLPVLAAMYFLEDLYGRLVPPPLTHPEFYYGFVGVTLAFQMVYVLIGLDPVRYRPMMPIAAFAKATFVAAIAVLVFRGRVPAGPAMIVVPDLIFAVLFMYAYVALANALSAP